MFSFYLIARFVVVLAAQMQTVVTGWQVYEATKSTFNLGLVGLAFFLPYMVAMPFAGDAADRFNRGKIAGLSSICFGLLILVQALWIDKYPSQMLGTLVVLCGLGSAKAFASASHGSMLALIVEKEKLMKSISINTAMFNISSIGGPVIGGFLYARFGAVSTLYLAALIGFLGGVIFLLLPVRTLQASGDESRFTRIAAGFKYIWKEKDILGSISLDLFAVFFGGAVALLPVFAQDILHVGPESFGVLRGGSALGAVLTAIYLARRPIVHYPGRKLFVAVTIFGLAMVGFGLSRSFWLSFGLLAISGAADMISVYVRHGLLQLRVSEDMRGRVTAANQVFIGASNELGEFESGMAASAFGPVGAVVGGGVITLACAFMWRKFFPSLANLKTIS